MPKSELRATRTAGMATRRRVLDHAASLFTEHGYRGVSVKMIADTADVFPSQITYYFGSKDRLFVEAGCREVLHVGAAVEKAGMGARDPASFATAIVAAALDAPSLLLFAESMSLARFDPELQAMVAATLDRLHHEGARAVASALEANDWQLRMTPMFEARAFWGTVVGVALQQGALPGGPDPATTEAVVSMFFSLHPQE